ncbi:gamma-glutamyl-gamma-aminobutyrate hydrolase family protein [Streptomyces odontomachi]|uniref:gamma-glutamyl-gamma-aminobutyrate hydrolase family protein n=1 Tax=Streptomyces odontomachi TaxID=2944940 RepID=UPI00272E8E64|nr:gamma-glutamyl-gamma-aminobutyrate hydrolase family protein [Streptomyces sp. ODS25]
MKPLIGITSRFRTAMQSHALHRGYVDQVVRAGGVPIIIPCIDENLCDPFLSRIDGLLLTGGEDMDPAYCTGTTRQDGYQYHPTRDAFELSLTTAALAAGLPTLGVCRGCQVLYAATGNPLISHVPDVNDGLVDHRKSLSEPSRHSVTLTGGSTVARAYRQRSIDVTSYHHQGLGEPAAGDYRWRVTARSDDSLGEAIEHVGDAWAVGVLWHPELPVPGDDFQDPLVAAFVAAAGAG